MPATALGRVHDLEVLDVHARPRPSTAVIRASAPGSSGIATCSTATPERTGRLRGQAEPRRLRRARTSPPRPRRRRRRSRSREPLEPRDVQVDRRRRSARFATQDVAPERGVATRRAASGRGSRRRRAARISGSSASSVAARPISDVEATWGRWLTIATSRSWRSGVSRTGRAPIARDHASRTLDGVRGRSSVGGARPRRSRPRPRRRRGRARSARSRPSGGPATNRADRRGRRRVLDRRRPPRSFTLAGVRDDGVGAAAQRARRTVGAIVRDRRAPPRRGRRRPPLLEARSRGRARPRRGARAASRGRDPNPDDAIPARAAASAIEVPIRPVPTTATATDRPAVSRRRRGHRAALSAPSR